MNIPHQPRKAPEIFDRHLLYKRQQRAARRFAEHDFLHQLIAEDIIDRLETVMRSFPSAHFTGPGTALLKTMLSENCSVGNVSLQDPLQISKGDQGSHRQYLVEEKLSAESTSLNLVISLMELHTMNDLPGYLIQARRALKPDGLFIAALPAEDTLTELRHSLYEAETELTGGVSPRVHPFASLKDLGALMQRAGFTLPVADIIRIPVTYRDPAKLIQDLRYMGETNILRNRKTGGIGRKLMKRTMEIYREKFPSHNSNGVTASFQIAMLTGWAPHDSQQKPLKPGSGKVSLEEAIRKI
ncbi:MAG: class I SAM-dependent methyltransferase [Aquisalinus sp.]|nr:class I SAM-dependent methyltransferase [Aquisalinus sp.]